MRYDEPLLEGTVVARPKRALVEVKLRSGEQVFAHYVGVGSLKGCAEVGCRVLLSVKEDPRRLYRHQVEISYAGRTAVGVHASRLLTVAHEAIENGKIPALMGYATLRADPIQLRDAGIHFQLEGNGLRTCNISVRSVTYGRDSIGYFPDAPVTRGVQILTKLTDLVREGGRTVMLFLAQRSDVDMFRPADDIDPEYCTAFRDAVARGVEALCYRTKVTRRGIELERQIPVDLGD